jgi:hypothetical protein
MDQEGSKGCDCSNLLSQLKLFKNTRGNLKCCEINGYKKGRTQIFPPSSFFVLVGSGDPRSGMEENRDPG